ncbi:MAG: hypothetical protein HN673_03280 [Rhodospirillales bacterium]|nr:hypothetical protein [Rhodospirillales bacterium]
MATYDSMGYDDVACFVGRVLGVESGQRISLFSILSIVMRSQAKPKYAVFLLSMGCAVVFWLLFAGISTLVVDPYGIDGSPVFQNFNVRKPHSYRHRVEAKMARVRRLNVATLVLGNSRVDAGFDPKSLAWPRSLTPVFNLGIPNYKINSSIELVEGNNRLVETSNIFLGIDYLDFISSVNCELPPKVGVTEAAWWEAGIFIKTHFSLMAIVDSLRTIGAQRQPGSRHMTEDGFNPWDDTWESINLEGQAVIFEQKNRENLKSYVARNTYCSRNTDAPEWLAILRFLRKRALMGKKTFVFLHPYHADILASMSLTGHIDTFNQFKRSLAREISIITRETGATIPLWDFAAMYPPNISPAPKKGELGVASRWYWEAGHYRKSLGDKMLKRMLGALDSDLQFGDLLIAKNFEDVISRQTHLYDTYRTQHYDDVTRIERLKALVSH